MRGAIALAAALALILPVQALAAPLQTAPLLWERDDLGPAYDLAVSPDGQTIYVAAEQGLLALNASSGENLWSVELGPALSVDACAKGLVAVLSMDSVTAIDQSGAKLWFISLKESAWSGIVAWGPNCSTLAVGAKTSKAAGSRGLFALVSAVGVLTCWFETEAPVTAVNWSPDGALVTFALGNGRIVATERGCVQAWTTAPRTARFLGSDRGSVSWSPDGSSVAGGFLSTTRGELALTVSCYDRSGRTLWTSAPLTGPVSSLDWRPEGLAAASGSEVLLLDDHGRVVWSTGALGRGINLVRWSPNGGVLAALLDRRLVVLDSSGRIVLDSG